MIPLDTLLKEKELNFDIPYLGQVVDNNSSDENYSLKVRIYPFFQGVKDNQLLWVPPLNLSEERIEKLPENNSWVWCVFLGDPLNPYWVYRRVTSQAGKYDYIRTQATARLQALGLQSLTYPKFDIKHVGNVYVIINSEKSEFAIIRQDKNVGIYINQAGEIKLIDNTSSFEMIADKMTSIVGQNKIELGNNSIKVTHLTGAVIEISSTGAMKIIPGTGMSITLNNGTMGANDFPACLFTGAPHCLDPLKSVKVP